MKKCIVIGGGFAGLSAASFLLSEGYSVEVIESSPKLGGRAYSIPGDENICSIDNGQHILMGCYTETLNFIKLIGADKNFIIQDRLKVSFLKEHFKHFSLEAPNKFYPFNLAAALFNYKALSYTERFQLFKLFIKIPLIPEKDLARKTVDSWLTEENQNDNIRSSFWDILAVGALNTGTEKASAQMFLRILKQIFYKGNKAASIIIPGKGLSEAYCSDAVSFIERNGGIISTGESADSLVSKNNRITEVITSRRRITTFDYLISAVPHYAYKKLLQIPEDSIEFEYSSILSFHLWVNRNPLKERFYALINSSLHWIFNQDTHMTLVISNADYLISKSKEELYNIVLEELEKFCGITREDIDQYKVIKEKRATFIPSVGMELHRPGTETNYQNFFIAGDWVNTGLPSTIESAVKSGRMAADAVIYSN